MKNTTKKIIKGDPATAYILNLRKKGIILLPEVFEKGASKKGSGCERIDVVLREIWDKETNNGKNYKLVGAYPLKPYDNWLDNQFPSNININGLLPRGEYDKYAGLTELYEHYLRLIFKDQDKSCYYLGDVVHELNEHACELKNFLFKNSLFEIGWGVTANLINTIYPKASEMDENNRSFVFDLCALLLKEDNDYVKTLI